MQVIHAEEDSKVFISSYNVSKLHTCIRYLVSLKKNYKRCN